MKLQEQYAYSLNHIVENNITNMTDVHRCKNVIYIYLVILFYIKLILFYFKNK